MGNRHPGPSIPSSWDRGFSVWVILGHEPSIPRTIKTLTPHSIDVERIRSSEIRVESIHEQHSRTRNAPGHLERASATAQGLGIREGVGPSLGAGRHRAGTIAPATAGRNPQPQGCCSGKRLLSGSSWSARPRRENPQRRKEKRSANPTSRPPHQAAASTKNIRHN